MRRLVLVLFATVLFCSAAEVQQVPVNQFLIDGNKVKDPDAPVSLQLPSGWTLFSAVRWGQHETTLAFLDQKTHQIVSLYYQFPIQVIYPADPQAFLVKGMNAKVVQRQKEEGLADYRIRAGSVKNQVVNEHPALSFVADYTAPARGTTAGRPMVEYMLRVLSQTMKAHFFLMLPAGLQTEDMMTRLDALVQTLNIP